VTRRAGREAPSGGREAPGGGRDQPVERSKASPAPRKGRRPQGQLNTEYNFERFVRGREQRFRLHGCLRHRSQPGKAYNPCMIYGGVGLGKTHLLQAIGNSAWQEFEDLKVVYVTAETFTNEFIPAIKEKHHHQLQEQVPFGGHAPDRRRALPARQSGRPRRSCSNTFNALYTPTKQMVFTA